MTPTTPEPRALRTPVVAGNWKMHKGPSETREFLRQFKPRCSPRADRTLLLFPPALALTTAADMLRDRPDLGLGVQNIHWKSAGAFTGEISAPMAHDAGARFSLVGHSERRHVFGESDLDVRQKVAAAFEGGLIPVLCLGETIEQRRAGRVDDVILGQLDTALEGLAPDRAQRILIAYEPVWAIGTGVNATPDDAAAAHAVLRRRLEHRLGGAAGRAIPILYGGSVKPDNARDLLSAPDVDGLLVGGASLDPASFAAIAAA